MLQNVLSIFTSARNTKCKFYLSKQIIRFLFLVIITNNKTKLDMYVYITFKNKEMKISSLFLKKNITLQITCTFFWLDNTIVIVIAVFVMRRKVVVKLICTSNFQLHSLSFLYSLYNEIISPPLQEENLNIPCSFLAFYLHIFLFNCLSTSYKW